MWCALTVSGGAVAAPLTVDTNELEAYRKAKDRFESRMGALELDTREVLEAQADAEREKLSSGYDALIRVVEDAEGLQRTAAIAKFEDFLRRYPKADYANHIRFRLAELHWEVASEQWLVEKAAYEELYQKLDEENRLEELPPDPKMNLARVVQLYEEIVADNLLKPPEKRYEFLDGALYSLAFVYKEPNAEQTDDVAARRTFEQLLAVAPNSPLADDAHLNIGNFLFEESRFEESIAEYWQVYKKGKESRLYSDAMYQLAWAYYKLDVYDKPRDGDAPDATALALFARLLDYSEQLFVDTGKRSEYAPDATRFMAFSFADMGEEQGREPLEIAEDYFASIGGEKKYQRAVYIALGDVLTKYGRFEQAVPVYRRLQLAPWQNEGDNPQFQMLVVKLLNSGLNRDPAASALARIELTEKYNDKSGWWIENRNNPEALAVARGFIEESLADVAIEYRKTADATGDAEAYRMAAAKFREYLERFPISDDYFQMQWYLADTLYRGKDYAAAAPEYEALIRSRKNHNFGDGSVYQRMRSLQEVAVSLHGPINALPADASAERTYTSVAGKPITVYALSPHHEAFAQSASEVLGHTFAPQTDPNQPDWLALATVNRAPIQYVVAEMLFRHNRFDEARPKLLAIVDQMPKSLEASYAAGLIVDSYVTEGDLERVREYSKRFSAVPLGPDTADTRGRTQAFKNAEQGAAFQQAMAYIEAGKREEAAEAFLTFIRDYPKADVQVLKDALYNAANSYDIAGKPEKANELFERYVSQYPSDPSSAGLYFRIGANYESTFELDKAISYYELLLKYFKADPNTADALYNASFLKIGLGDNAGAAKGFEDYARLYPERSDVEDVYFRAGEQWEAVSAAKAVAFYEGYLSKYALTNPEHGLVAEYRLAQLYKKQNNAKKHDALMARLLTDFDALVASNRAGDLRTSIQYVAEAAFLGVDPAYAKLTKDQLSGNDEKDADLIARKITEVDDFRAVVQGLGLKYGDFERITQARYLAAAATLYRVDLAFGLRPPAEWSEEEQAAYMEILENEVFPELYELQDAAKVELTDLVAFGKERKLHSSWISKAVAKLNEIDPFAFPAEKVEVRAPVSFGSAPAAFAPKTVGADR